MVVVHFGDFGYVRSLWTLTVCLSCVLWKPVEGQIQVIGSHQPIVAAPGEDVLLPCLLRPKCDVEALCLTVEWSRMDLKPDPVDPLYVHVYREKQDDLNMILPSYLGRTKLFPSALREGNISLWIKNVTLTDTGQYKCFIPNLNRNSKHSVVKLVVDPNYVKMTTTETPLEPRDLQTPEPSEETNIKGRRHRLIAVIVPVVVFLIVVFGVAAAVYSHKKMKHQTVGSGGSAGVDTVRLQQQRTSPFVSWLYQTPEVCRSPN